MSSCVWVLCPNGHRITISVSPNTTLNQIKQEACAKQGFQSSNYGLKKEDMKKSLDLSLPFRFSGLSNRAKLELVEEVQRSVLVNIAVQVQPGTRLHGNVLNTASILDTLTLITGLSRFGDETQLVYLQKKINRSEFASTTLVDIGILQGNALLRLEGVDVSSVPAVSHDVPMETVLPSQSESSPTPTDSFISEDTGTSQSSSEMQVKESTTTFSSSLSSSRIDRIPVLFCPNSEASLGNGDPGDEFFEVTERDIRTLLRDLNAITERPFMLRSREKAGTKKSVREESIIRIRLPGGFLLQNIFTTRTSNTGDLYGFVSQYLTTDTAGNLTLFVAPPKRLINKGIPFSEAGLEGTVLVHAGGAIKLKPDLHVVSPEEATRQLEKVLEVGSPSPPVDDNKQSADNTEPIRKPEPGVKKKVVPKWFKM